MATAQAAGYARTDSRAAHQTCGEALTKNSGKGTATFCRCSRSLATGIIVPASPAHAANDPKNGTRNIGAYSPVTRMSQFKLISKSIHAFLSSNTPLQVLAASLISFAAFAPGSARAATTSCTPTAGFTNCVRVTASGANQTFVVPANVSSIQVRVWAAGGGGSDPAYWANYGGGGGGYVIATIAVTPGETLNLTVGAGGVIKSIVRPFGGGGAGGYAVTNKGASGGGLSGIWRGIPFTAGNALVIAGGGGGATPGSVTGRNSGGGGGGLVGNQDAYPTESGRGGTQSAGGAASTVWGSCSTPPTSGGLFQGGNGAGTLVGDTATYEGGGGGGGGYYGGGGGSCQKPSVAEQNGAGGGGSSFIAGSGVSGASTLAGSNSTASNTGGVSGGNADPLYQAGIGLGGGAGSGGNGEIVIEYITTADLSVTKSDAVPSINAGGTTAYAITVTNNGPASVTGAVLSDPVTAGLVVTSVTCSATPSKCVTPPTIAQLQGTTFALPTLANGETYRITVNANVTATSGSVSNVANITAPSSVVDPNSANNSATDSNTVTPVADLSVTKSDGVATVNPNGSTTYTVTVTNNGPSSVTGAIIKDPAATGLNKSAVSCGTTPGQCTAGTTPTIAQIESVGGYALPALAPGQTYQLRITATVSATSGSVANTVTIAAPSGTTDGTAANNSATDTNTVVPVVQLTVLKTNGVTSAYSGSTVTYTISVTNNGPDAAVGAVVTDSVVTGLTCPPSNPVTFAGSGTPSGSFTISNLTSPSGITLGTLASGQTATLNYSCQVN